jgi:hypothetical protein
MFQARLLRNCLDTDKDNAHTLNHKRALLLLALVDLFNGDTTSVPTLCSSVLCSPIGIEGADEYEDNSVPAYLQASAMLIHYFAACGGTQMDLRIDRRLDSSSTIVAFESEQFDCVKRAMRDSSNDVDEDEHCLWLRIVENVIGILGCLFGGVGSDIGEGRRREDVWEEGNAGGSREGPRRETTTTTHERVELEWSEATELLEQCDNVEMSMQRANMVKGCGRCLIRSMVGVMKGVICFRAGRREVSHWVWLDRDE